MLNQVIPFVELGVENDPSGKSFPISVGDFPACFVSLVDHAGEDLQPCLGHGFLSPLAGIRGGEYRCSAPGACYLGEEPVLDGVVLGAVGRVVHHDNLHSYPVGEADEVLLDDMVGAGVGAASVAEYHQHPCVGIGRTQMLPPAGLDVVAHELGGVVAGADGEVPSVSGDVVDAVRHDGPLGEGGEVVVERPGRSRAEHGALPLEVADKLLLLRVDADDRDAGLDANPLDLADFLELPVPPLDLAHRDVFAERPRLETASPYEAADMVFGDVRPALEELAPDGGGLDVEPDGVLVLRVTRHMLGHYLHEAFLPFRMLGDLVLRAASGPADPALAWARLLAKLADSFADRLCGNVEELAQGLYRKAVVPGRLARNKKPSLPFIECHKERHLLFLEPYWGFLLQPCICLVINYKDTKVSPFICYLNH